MTEGEARKGTQRYSAAILAYLMGPGISIRHFTEDQSKEVPPEDIYPFIEYKTAKRPIKLTRKQRRLAAQAKRKSK